MTLYITQKYIEKTSITPSEKENERFIREIIASSTLEESGGNR